MRQTAAVGLLVLWSLLVSAGAGASTEVTADNLLIDPARYDGETVSVVGELIGDYGFRGDGSAWSQLNGDSYARAPLLEGGNLTGSNIGIGIRAPAAVIEVLDPPGDYQHRGPVVRATGTWKYHDVGRGGETYLDAVTIEVLEPGRALGESVDPVVVIIGALLTVSALWLGYRTRQRSAD